MVWLWRLRDLPIQQKISFTIFFGMATAIVFIVTNFILFDRDNVKKDLQRELQILAQVTAQRSALAVIFRDYNNANQNLSTLAVRSTIQHACIYNDANNAQLVAKYQRPESPYRSCPPSLNLPYDVLDNSDDLLIVIEPIVQKTKRVGQILIASDLSPISNRTHKWLVTAGLVGSLAMFVVFLMTSRLRRYIVKPIEDLAGLMDRVRSTQNLTLRADVIGQDEVGRLVSSFNQMLHIVQRNREDMEAMFKQLVEKSALLETHSASLEIRNQQIKELNAAAAHDLRQPLQAMHIFAQSLAKRIVDTGQREILSKLQLSMKNLDGLFKEILDASRYEFDLSSSASQPISIGHLLNKIHLEFDAIAQQKGLKLKFFTADYKVLDQSALLERIIRNLVSNAIRYTDKGGVLLGCRKRGRFLSIEIWDTGRGIPNEKQTQIFGKFVQVMDDDRAVRGGFGLGLAMVKQFADTLGYHLQLQSVVGKGTVFKFKVPILDLQVVESQLAAGHFSNSTVISSISTTDLAVALNNPSTVIHHAVVKSVPKLNDVDLTTLINQDAQRILLVDDNSAIRSALKQLLEDWGFHVDEFDCLASAMNFYRQGGKPPAVIVSDLELERGDTGDDLIRQVRTAAGKIIPALIVSATTNVIAIDRVRATQIPLLEKPVKPARLRAMINHLLQ